jgi:CDP-diacylglycerol--glycerol-3-phosphate 3-phosphatidyltransferase
MSLRAALRRVPIALVAMRLALAGIVLLAGLRFPLPSVFAGCLAGALVSDILDGVIARRLGVATQRLRRLDSLVDTLFYACALAAAWILHPELLRPHAAGLAVLLALELARYVLDWSKFGKEASYHMWSSKIWGLLLCAGMWSILVEASGGWPVSLAIAWGILADLEGLAISIALRSWRSDVPTLIHALRLRRREVRAVDSRSASVPLSKELP